MFIDFIGKGFTGLIMTKRDAKRANQAGLMAYNSEWAKQITMRSSRDRIARGAIINSILITVTLSQKQDLQDNLWITILAGCAITLIITAMWYRFKKLSDRFETHCHNYLQKINNYPVDKEHPIISAEPFASAVKPASSTAIPPC